MKRFLMALAVLMGVTLSASAQKGMKQVGADYVYTYNGNYKQGFSGFDVKFLFNSTNTYRLGVAYTYTKAPGGQTNWMAEWVNNAFFGTVRRFRPFFIFGVACGEMTWKKKAGTIYDYSGSAGMNRNLIDVYDLHHRDYALMARIGLGFDIRILPFLSLQLEASALGGAPFKFDQFILFGTPQAKAGVTYNF